MMCVIVFCVSLSLMSRNTALELEERGNDDDNDDEK